MTGASQDIILQIENLVLAFLKTFPPGTRFLAAVSGGADSMAMLACLCAGGFASKSAVSHNAGDLRFSCIHVEHGIRPAGESRGDAFYVRGFCKKNGIDCRVKHIPPGKVENFARRKGTGIEAAARFYRHRALSRRAAELKPQLGGEVVILLAHTKDDLLETALMRLLRGAGPAGLAAMPAVSNKNGYVIARPLLQVSRAEIECYLTAKNIAWREDLTNTDEKFLRNRIRGKLVPLLNDSFPSWKAGIAQTAQTQSLAADFIAQEAKERVFWRKNSEELLFTDEANFFAQPLIIREEAVFIAINIFTSAALRELITIKSIKRSVIRKFCEGSVNAADLGAVKIRREKGKIIVFKARKEFFENGISRLIK